MENTKRRKEFDWTKRLVSKDYETSPACWRGKKMNCKIFMLITAEKGYIPVRHVGLLLFADSMNSKAPHITTNVIALCDLLRITIYTPCKDIVDYGFPDGFINVEHVCGILRHLKWSDAEIQAAHSDLVSHVAIPPKAPYRSDAKALLDKKMAKKEKRAQAKAEAIAKAAAKKPEAVAVPEKKAEDDGSSSGSSNVSVRKRSREVVAANDDAVNNSPPPASSAKRPTPDTKDDNALAFLCQGMQLINQRLDDMEKRMRESDAQKNQKSFF